MGHVSCRSFVLCSIKFYLILKHLARVGKAQRCIVFIISVLAQSLSSLPFFLSAMMLHELFSFQFIHNLIIKIQTCRLTLLGSHVSDTFDPCHSCSLHFNNAYPFGL